MVEENNNTINFVSEITGMGKTGYFLDMISQNYKDKWLIVVPNKILCKEVMQRLVDRDVSKGIKIINSDTDSNPSVTLSNNIYNPRTINIIITTHQSFLIGLKDGIVRTANKWNLLIDEELSFYKHHEFNVSEYSKDIIEQMVKVENYSENFYKVKPKDRLLWNDIAIGNCNDDFVNLPKFVEMVKLGISNTYTTLIPKQNYHEFLEYEPSIKNNKLKKFYAISLCNEKFFSSFKSVTILCSFFEKTISYKLMKWMGFDLKKISIPSSYKVHNNSNLVKINYYCKSNWSSLLKNKKVNNSNKTLEEYIKETIMLELNGSKFIYNANVNFRNKFNQGKLVNTIHGVNKYIDYENMVFMPSLNATASLVNVLGYFGLTRTEIDFSRNVLCAYQFLSRGAIRKYFNENEINIYVMDERTVLFLKTILPNAIIQYHNAESLLTTNKIKKANEKAIPSHIRSFMSRVNKRLHEGKLIRNSTLKKLKDYEDLYYNTTES